MDIVQLLNIDSFYAMILIINLAIAVVILAGVKFISAMISNVDATKELSKKDNHAFGISIAGVALGVSIMMTGVMSGEASQNYKVEFILVTAYGILGVFLMSLTRLIFDKVSMPHFSIKDEVAKGNVAAAIIDAGNVVATAVIIRAVMIWMEGDTLSGMMFVLAGYVLSQAILSLVSLYRVKSFNAHHKSSLHEVIVDGNVATAWRFSGFRIGVALAITAASGMVPYSTDNLVQIGILWLVISIIMMIVMFLIVEITDKVILSGIDVREEVDNQKNTGIAAIQFAVTISVGIIIATLAS